MENELKPVSLRTLAGGAVDEIFKHELNKVIENITDLNTEPDKKRKITLEVAITPTKDREMGVVSITCKSNLVSIKPVETTIFIGKDNGMPVAYQKNPNEPEFSFKDQVVSIEGGKENA